MPREALAAPRRPNSEKPHQRHLGRPRSRQVGVERVDGLVELGHEGAVFIGLVVVGVETAEGHVEDPDPEVGIDQPGHHGELRREGVVLDLRGEHPVQVGGQLDR